MLTSTCSILHFLPESRNRASCLWGSRRFPGIRSTTRLPGFNRFRTLYATLHNKINDPYYKYIRSLRSDQTVIVTLYPGRYFSTLGGICI